MFKLNRWISQLPEEAINYLVSIQRQQEDEIWAWPADRSIGFLVERGFLEKARGRYTHQHRYLIPIRTKLVLESRAEAFRDIRGIGQSPWNRP